MASWEEYKKKHGIQSAKQEQSAFDGGAAWEQYKKENNISSDNTDWRETLYQRDQARQKAAAERRQDKNALRAQKNYLDNFVGPNPIGGKETAQANYYSNLAAYGSKWGDAAALNEGFARYRQALASVDDAYQQEISRNKKQDVMYDVASRLNPFQTERTVTRQFEAAGKRYARDAQLYSQMDQAANQTGSKALWEKAAAGDAKSREAYSKAVEQYGAAYSKYHPAEYYAQTMTKDELQSELDRMNALDEKYKAWTQKEARTGGYYGSLADVANDLTSAKIRDEKFNQKSAGKLQKIENEIGDRESFYEKKASLEHALKLLDEQEKTAKYEEVANAFLSKGPQESTAAYTSGGEDLEYNYVNPLTKEAQALAEKGRAAYENDQKSGAHYTDGDRFGGGGGKASAEGVDLAKFIGEQRTKNTAKTFAELGPEEGELEQWQRDIFYALYAKDPEAAWDWLAIAQERADEEYYNRISDYYSKGLSRIYGLPFAAGLSLASGISPYSEKGQKMSKTAEAITRGGAQAIQEKGILNTGLLSGTIAESVPIIGGKGLGDLYQLAESMVQSGALAVAASAAGDYGTTVGAAVEFLGTVAMGRGVAASDYRDSLARGMEKEQAMLHATAAGIAEAAFEYISLDKLVKTDISKGFWKNVLTQGGVEASEELCTTIANRLSDGILARQNGYDTQIEQRTKELIALGASRKDAEAQAEKEWFVDLINDGLGGFISGGFMSAGNTLANWNAYKSTMEGYGSGVTEAENAALQAYAADNGIRLESIQRQAQGEAQTEQQAEEAPKSTRETRKEKKANRKIGEALTKVVDSIEQKVSDAGLQSAERVYSDTVQRYGTDISNAAEAAVVRVATRDFAEAYNSSAETARTAYNDAMQAAKSEPVREAIREAWEGVTKRAALLGDKVAAQEAIIGAGNGKMLNLGAEIATKDGEAQQVQITALGAKRGTVRLDNGSVVELDALQGLDADTKDVIDRLDAFDLGSARSMAFQAYRLAVAKGEVTDGVRWVMSYALAYDQGRTGTISLQEAIRRSSLPADIVKDAYKLGAEQTETWRKQKEAENAKKRAAAKDGATGRKGILDSSRASREKMDSLSADKQDAIRTMELLAEATGVDIRLIAQKANAKGNVTGYQGKYSADGNYIEIDINAGLNNIYKDLHTGMTAVLGHELTHWMQENAPTEYLAYKKAVLQAIMSTKSGEMHLERMITAQIKQNKKEGKEITRSEAEDEVVADASMKRMGDEEFWDAVADNLGEKKADVAARIRDYISKFFQRVREIIGQASHTSEAARIVDQAEAEVQANLRKLYAELTGAAMRNSAQTGEDTKNAATEGGKQSDEKLSTRSTTDSTGRELSEGQQAYFKDSRARDINGNLLVLYHQTENDFTVFDPRHEGSGTRDQQTPFGIFLKSSDRDIGVKGKKQMALYANITKPLVALNRESLESKLRDLSPEYAKLSDQHKAIDREYKQKHEQSKQAFTDYLTTWREQHPNAGRSEIYQDADFDRLWNAEDEIIDKWEQKARELETETKEVLTNALEAAGYDGIFIGNDTGSWGRSTDAYIALHPEQVKNVDNLNPTENPDIRFSTRDYSDMSDLDLAINAANEISEGGGEDYWASLLESNPGLASEAEEIKHLGKQLQDTEAKLAEARRNLTLTDRKLKTRGISTLAATIMQDQKAGDINNKDVKNRIVAVLTEAYQKALDKLDAGGDFSDAWEIVYYEGAEKAADILMQDATHAEKIGYKWYTNTLGEFLGEGGRGYVAADIASRLAVDFEMNRYRPGQKGTIADRLVERAENRMNKKLSEAKTKAETLQAKNTKLQEEKEFYKSQAEQSKDTAGFLYKQLLDEREALKNNKKLSDDERKKTLKRLDNLEKQMKAKRREAQIWKDKAQIGWKAANKAVQEKQAAVDKLEKQLQRERDILSGKLKPPAIQSMLKAAREREAARVTQHKDEVFARYKERKNETALRNQIKNLHKEMNRDLLKPREGHFVPQGLIRSVVDLLDMVNTQTTRAKSESAKAKIDAINAAYDRIKSDERYSQYYDETVKAMLTELSATLEGRSVYDLSYAELEDVYTVMKAMRTTIRNTIKADLIEKGKEAWEIGNALRKELRASKGASHLLLEKYHMAMLSAERAFHRFGGYMPNSAWDKVYRMLDNAQLKMLTLEMQATRLFDPVLKEKADFKQAEALTSYDKKDLVDIGLKDENGNTVPITRGMMLALYMHLQNEENMRHLMYGGLTLPDFRRYYKGQENAWGRSSVSIPALGARVSNLDALLDTIGEDGVEERYKAEQDAMREMWESVRQAIEEKLSPYDKKWIEASKEFFDDFSRRELNRVTNEMYGFSKAKVDNYFPIVTDRNFLKTEFDSISRDISLENAGFMKERVKAGNPILLEDITRAVNRQISNVSRYAGLTQALKTFGNVYNVQLKGYTDSVKKAMSETFEDTGKKYIENLITDMIGGRTQPGSIFDRVKGNYAQAVLSANLSVTVKQAASFPTAAATVGWKPLMKALVKGGRNRRVISRADRTLIDTYSPLLWKRSQGAIDTEIGDMAHAQDWTKKAKWLMGWIEKTDIATVGRLWYAAEYYVQENYDLQKGSEAQIKNGESPFYQKVAEVFNRIVEDTQPNYTVLQRPDILRNPNKLVRAMTMFSTQRFQNANILLDAAGEYSAMRRRNRQSNTAESKAALKASKQKLTHAISSQAVSAVLLNVMTLVAGAILHRMNPWRDDDDELTQESILEECANEFFSTVAGSFLGGSELYEAISSILTGSKYYGNDVGGISTINDFVTAVVQFGQKAVKLIGDEESKPEDWTKLAENQLAKVGQYLAQMTGVPVANINKIIAGGKNHIIDMINGEFFSFEAGVERSNATNARRLIKALEAGDNAKADAVMEEMRQNILKDKPNLKADKVNAKIQSAVQSYVKQQYLDDEMSEEKAIHYMVEYGSADDVNDAFWKIREWEAREAWDGEADAFSFSKYTKLREIIDNVGDISEEMQYLQDHGVKFEDANKEIKSYIGKQLKAGEYDEDEAIKTLQAYHKVKDKKTKQYRPDTDDEAWFTVQEWQAEAEHAGDEDYSWNKYEDLFAAMDAGGDIEPHADELESHGINADTIKNAVVAHVKKRYEADEIAEDADKKIRYNKLIAANPGLDVAESVVNTWYDKAPENYGKTMKQAGIPLEIFADYAEKASKAAGVDADGDGKTDSGSKKKAILQIIDGLNLTNSQKDALYYLNGYAASKLYEVPWH